MAKLNVSCWTWLLGLPTTSRFGWKHTPDTHKRFSKDFNPHSAARINNISVEVGQCWSLGNGKHFKICLLLNRYCSVMEAVDLCWPHFCAPLSLLSIFLSVLKPFIICQNNPDQTEAHMSDSKTFQSKDLLCTTLASYGSKVMDWTKCPRSRWCPVSYCSKQSSFCSYEKSSTEGGRKQQWRTRNRPSDYFRGSLFS